MLVEEKLVNLVYSWKITKVFSLEFMELLISIYYYWAIRQTFLLQKD